MRLLRLMDPGRAILAFLLALGLWMVVQNEQNPERSQLTQFTVPVDVVDIPPGLTLVGEAPRVQLWVRALESTWPRLRAESFRARVNAAGINSGVVELPVEVDILESSVFVAEPRPERVRLRLEQVRENTVPVRVDPSGSVPFGYTFASPKVSPDHVTVSGPESLVELVEAAVVNVRMEGVTVSLSGNFSPRPVDGRGTEVKGVTVNPPQVSVEVPVNQEVAYKEVGIRPVTQGKLPPGYYMLPVEVDPPIATIVGNPGVISSVGYLETEAVDISDASSSVVRRAKLVLPPGVSLLQPQLTVLVTVRVQPLELTQSIRLTPTVEGLGPDLLVASPLPLVELTVSGPAPTLQALSSQDFRVTVNLADQGPGRHTVEPQVSLPSSFRLVRLEPRVITVEIKRADDGATPTAGATASTP